MGRFTFVREGWEGGQCEITGADMIGEIKGGGGGKRGVGTQANS